MTDDEIDAPVEEYVADRQWLRCTGCGEIGDSKSPDDPSRCPGARGSRAARPGRGREARAHRDPNDMTQPSDAKGEAKLTMGPDEEMTSTEREAAYDRTRVQCRDRGEATFQSHVDVARHTGVAIDWLEDRLRAESITGFELDDGLWVTTVLGVKEFLTRKPAPPESG